MQADLFIPGQEERRKGAQVLQENHSGHGLAPKAQPTWMKNAIRYTQPREPQLLPELKHQLKKTSQPQMPRDTSTCPLGDTDVRTSCKNLYKALDAGAWCPQQAQGPLSSVRDHPLPRLQPLPGPAPLAHSFMARRFNFSSGKKGTIPAPGVKDKRGGRNM